MTDDRPPAVDCETNIYAKNDANDNDNIAAQMGFPSFGTTRRDTWRAQKRRFGCGRGEEPVQQQQQQHHSSHCERAAPDLAPPSSDAPAAPGEESIGGPWSPGGPAHSYGGGRRGRVRRGRGGVGVGVGRGGGGGGSGGGSGRGGGNGGGGGGGRRRNQEYGHHGHVHVHGEVADDSGEGYYLPSFGESVHTPHTFPFPR